jgi:hypothetical protein
MSLSDTVHVGRNIAVSFYTHSKLFKFCVHVIISIFLQSRLSIFFFWLPLSLIDSVIDSVMHRDVLPGIHTNLYTYLRYSS